MKLGSGDSERPLLTVAVLTFRRPDQLRANVAAVRERAREALAVVDPRIVVVDNDPAGSARAVVHALGARPGVADEVPIVYVNETRPGIPAARNRALDEASRSRLLSFIDDDEVPQADWLTSLVDVWRRTGAAAVAGRVVSQLPADVDPWVAQSEFFRRATHETGERLPAAATGNLLLDLDAVRRLGLRFDESLGLTGGEDTVFTRELTRRGGAIVWCQESVAVDPVVPERATRAWVLQRAFAHGNVLQHTRLRLEATAAGRARAQVVGIAGGVARIAVATAQRAAAAVIGSANLSRRSEIQIRRGCGVLVGALGHRFEEYRRTEVAR